MIAAVLAAAALAAPQPQLLVVTETRGFVHDSIPAAKAMVGALGYRTRFLAGARQLTAARLRGADAVVFLNTSGELHLDAAGRGRLLAYVRDGGAFVGAPTPRLPPSRTGRPSIACWAPTSSGTLRPAPAAST